MEIEVSRNRLLSSIISSHSFLERRKKEIPKSMPKCQILTKKKFVAKNKNKIYKMKNEAKNGIFGRIWQSIWGFYYGHNGSMIGIFHQDKIIVTPPPPERAEKP
jgi:hypothetical protein